MLRFINNSNGRYLLRGLMLLAIIMAGTTFAYSQNADSVSIITVSKCKLGDVIPVFVKFVNNDGEDNSSLTGSYNIISTSENLSVDTVCTKLGKGSILAIVQSANNFSIGIDGYNGEKDIAVLSDIPQIVLSGEISIDSILINEFDYYINSDLTVYSGVELVIEPGTRIFIAENVNVFVDGKIDVQGTIFNPVLFSASDISKPWGGIILNQSNSNDTSSFSNCFFIKAGGNSSFVFGHSQSQAVIKADNSNIIVDNCYFIDNTGKCFGSMMSNLKISESYLTRSDTGGEFVQSVVEVKQVYVVDIPDSDHLTNDDDNDGFYFSGVHSSGETSIIDSCVFITGEDDGIDHNGAILEIRNCRIEDFYHEGIAASNANSVLVFNSLIKNCEQGIEAGYGNPSVSIEHCVIIDNDTGVRFGDSYDWGCSGNITLTNSIVYNNGDNIRNYDLATSGAILGAITASYSMINDDEYNDSPNCITGIPLFDDVYFLLPNSPGKGLASTGLDIGLYNSLSNVEDNLFGDSCFNVYPNPAIDLTQIHYYLKKQSHIRIVLSDVSGKIVAVLADDVSNSGNNIFVFNVSSYPTGIYLVSLFSDDAYVKMVKMFVK